MKELPRVWPFILGFLLLAMVLKFVFRVDDTIHYVQEVVYQEHPHNCQVRLHTQIYDTAVEDWDKGGYLFSDWCCVEGNTSNEIEKIKVTEMERAKLTVKNRLLKREYGLYQTQYDLYKKLLKKIK